MKRMMSLLVVLGVAMGVYAQDEEAAKPERFDALVRVMNLSSPTGMTVARAEGEATPVVAFKAYPYGSTFTLDADVTCRVYFSDMTYVAVRGPAIFTPETTDKWQKVNVKVVRGDYNFSLHSRVLPDQFTVTTPVGAFGSMQGRSKLHVGDIAAGVITSDDFSFRVLSGSAVFKGLHYSMSGMTEANAFVSSNAEDESSTIITGRVAEVKMDLPTSGDGKNVPFSLTPGVTVKVVRAKAPGSNNWTVSVLTLHANGEAQNYFCYVENRGEGYYTGELVAEILPPEEEGETEEGEEAQEDDYSEAESIEESEEMSDFDDYDLM